MFLFFCLAFHSPAHGQRFLTDYDSTLFIRDTVRPVIKRFENLRISGYIQPQFQVAERPGIESWAGGDFAEFADNRFMLRRARIKFDYQVPSENTHLPMALFTFQIDATERGVKVRDMFVRLYEPRAQNFSLSAGIFARPFGYEVNLSSSYRETPERGRASQILMPSERGLGAMVSYESQKADRKAFQFRLDAGFFNGQGLAGPEEFDSFKDLISRLTIKPVEVLPGVTLSGGLSLLYGGWRQATRYEYTMGTENGTKTFVVDSSLGNIGKKAPRRYYGADLQLAHKHAWGKTELRGEYWRGQQPGTAATTFNPGVLPEEPTYRRDFDAAFFYFLQNIINEEWEVMVKYDWYDPNTEVRKAELNSGLTVADIKYATLGMGLTHYFNDNLKVLAYYDWVRNEKTALPGFARDVQDNVFTLRMQLKF